jgi:hypothetical protein
MKVHSHLNPEDRGSTVLRNVGIQPPHHTTQQPNKPRKPQLSNTEFYFDTSGQYIIFIPDFYITLIGCGDQNVHKEDDIKEFNLFHK